MVTGAMTRSRWIALAVLSATFLAGAMLGTAATRLIAAERQQEQQAEMRRNNPRRDRGPSGPTIFDQVGLSGVQKALIDSIMEKRRRDTEAFWKEHGPELGAIVDSTRADVDRVLTPEQRQKFEEFRERRWRDHRPDGRGGQSPNWGPGPNGRDRSPEVPRDSTRRPISFHQPQYL